MIRARALINVVACRGFPDCTALMGSTVMINVGGMSPPWVRELVLTRAGTRLLIRILVGILTREETERVCAEIAEGLARHYDEWATIPDDPDPDSDGPW